MLLTMGFTPGKQTAQPAKPKKQSSGGGSGGPTIIRDTPPNLSHFYFSEQGAQEYSESTGINVTPGVQGGDAQVPFKAPREQFRDARGAEIVSSSKGMFKDFRGNRINALQLGQNLAYQQEISREGRRRIQETTQMVVTSPYRRENLNQQPSSGEYDTYLIGGGKVLNTGPVSFGGDTTAFGGEISSRALPIFDFMTPEAKFNKGKLITLGPYDTRAAQRNINNTSWFSYNLLGFAERKMDEPGQKTFLDSSWVVRAPTEWGREIISSVGRGIGKFFYAPNYGGTAPIIDLGQDKILRVKGPLFMDPDVQSVGILAASTISPWIARPVGLYVGYTGIKRFIAEGATKEEKLKGVLDIALGTGIASSLVNIGLARGKPVVSESAGYVDSLSNFPSKIVERIYNRGLRGVEYYSTKNRLTTEFGVDSPEVKTFEDVWKRAFSEIPRDVQPMKQFSLKYVEAAQKLPKNVQFGVENILGKYQSEIIGTSILPAYTGQAPPRGLSGDVDVQNARLAGSMASEIKGFLASKNVNVGLNERMWQGTQRYHITVDGKEFINIGTKPTYYFGQIEPVMNLFDITSKGAYVSTPGGVMLASLRDQLRVKTWKGYVEEARPKDVVDVTGLLKQTANAPYLQIPLSKTVVNMFESQKGGYYGGMPDIPTTIYEVSPGKGKSAAEMKRFNAELSEYIDVYKTTQYTYGRIDTYLPRGYTSVSKPRTYGYPGEVYGGLGVPVADYKIPSSLKSVYTKYSYEAPKMPSSSYGPGGGYGGYPIIGIPGPISFGKVGTDNIRSAFVPSERIEIPDLPDLMLGMEGTKGRRRRRFKYDPSIAALEFNIRAPKAPDLLSGLEIRPMV